MNHKESFDLPKPQPLPTESTENAGPNQTQAPGASAPEQHAVPPIAAAPAQPTASGSTPVADASTVQTTISDDGLAADDADLIEKEWVTRAKSIVNQTRNDPHAQNKQINQVKAEYIKKRYNVDIKVSDK